MAVQVRDERVYDVFLSEEEGGYNQKSKIKYKKCDAEYKMRIILLGESRVGKTSLISRYADNEFNPDQDRTNGVDTIERVISSNDNIVHLIILDTAGHEGYQTMHQSYSKQANGVFFVFDITNENSLKRIEQFWLPQYKKQGRDNAILFLIGTKIDKEGRKISYDEAKSFMQRNKLRKYYETSSLTGHGVESIFQTITFYILKENKDDVVKRQGLLDLHTQPGSPGSVKEKSCCQIL